MEARGYPTLLLLLLLSCLSAPSTSRALEPLLHPVTLVGLGRWLSLGVEWMYLRALHHCNSDKGGLRQTIRLHRYRVPNPGCKGLRSKVGWRWSGSRQKKE
jgi:hypothetical protein